MNSCSSNCCKCFKKNQNKCSSSKSEILNKIYSKSTVLQNPTTTKTSYQAWGKFQRSHSVSSNQSSSSTSFSSSTSSSTSSSDKYSKSQLPFKKRF